MKRGAPLQRKTPLHAKKPMARGSTTLTRSTIKKRAPKKRPGHNQAMLDACRGQHCYLRLPRGVCRDDVATTVPAHENQGKGMGLKVPDERTVPACYWCHYEYDQGKLFTREEKRAFFIAAHQRWAAYRDGQKE